MSLTVNSYHYNSMLTGSGLKVRMTATSMLVNGQPIADISGISQSVSGNTARSVADNTTGGADSVPVRFNLTELAAAMISGRKKKKEDLEDTDSKELQNHRIAPYKGEDLATGKRFNMLGDKEHVRQELNASFAESTQSTDDQFASATAARNQHKTWEFMDLLEESGHLLRS